MIPMVVDMDAYYACLVREEAAYRAQEIAQDHRDNVTLDDDFPDRPDPDELCEDDK